jgi:hypothetical protein
VSYNANKTNTRMGVRGPWGQRPQLPCKYIWWNISLITLSCSPLTSTTCIVTRNVCAMVKVRKNIKLSTNKRAVKTESLTQ